MLVSRSSSPKKKKKKNLKVCPLLMLEFFLLAVYSTLILGLIDEQAVSEHAINDEKDVCCINRLLAKKQTV